MFFSEKCLIVVILQLVQLHVSLGQVELIIHEMERGGIVPHVISKSPREVLKVTYNNLFVQFGNELTPKQVKYEPRVHWMNGPNIFYTLIMVDPDVPDAVNPTLGEMLHWLIGNIPGAIRTSEPLEITEGDLLAEYIGATPANGTGLHRYAFLVFKQPKKLKFEVKPILASSREGRSKFKTSEFAEKYKLGDAIAGNFYKAQFEEPDVPELI